jgi:SAM-dependent methyltransferase
MEPSESRRTSWTTAPAAEVYERARPGYAEAAVDFALAPVRDRPDRRVLDLGAGTGKLTRQLVARRLPTVAVEPAAGMRAALARAVRSAEVVAGAAEALPLAADSVDVVLAGQAFHWFEADRALPEIARVLRPGGVLALLYNSRDDGVAWVRALSDLVGELDRGDYVSRMPTERPPDLGAGLAFDAELRTPHEHELDLAGLVDLVASRSYVIRLPPGERAELLDRVAELARGHPQLVGRQHFWMPYLTSVQRYALRS